MIRTGIPLALCAALLAGGVAQAADDAVCASEPDPKLQKLSAYSEKPKLISDNLLVAIFSAIAYEERGLGDWRIPAEWTRSEASLEEPSSGFFAAVFLNEAAREVVVAIRGTELWSLSDWVQNFFPRWGGQAVHAKREIARLLQQYQGWRFTLTGHSLGGGLALQLSHELDDVSAVVFNPSPRIGSARNGYGNYRVVFREMYEPLAPLRGNPGRRSDGETGWQLRYEVLVNFSEGFVVSNMFRQHGMRLMAANMMALSRNWSAESERLFQLNCGG